MTNHIAEQQSYFMVGDANNKRKSVWRDDNGKGHVVFRRICTGSFPKKIGLMPMIPNAILMIPFPRMILKS